MLAHQREAATELDSCVSNIGDNGHPFWKYEGKHDSNETHHVQVQANLQAADDVSSRMNSSLDHQLSANLTLLL